MQSKIIEQAQIILGGRLIEVTLVEMETNIIRGLLPPSGKHIIQRIYTRFLDVDRQKEWKEKNRDKVKEYGKTRRARLKELRRLEAENAK